jgi:DNA polymerase
MKSASADELLPDELAALMHFYAESGVSWLLEDEPVDRFAEFAATPVRETLPSEPQPRSGGDGAPGSAERGRRVAAAPAPMQAPVVAVPDAEAVETARTLAASAPTIEALTAALEGFAGCNLRFSARHTVFATGNPSARLVVVGGSPSAEDDREGKPFSGSAGRMIDRMMAGIRLGAEDVMMVNMIPWRTPGDRAPTVREVEICAPFARRVIELMRPDAVLVLGNLPVRILSDSPRAGIHAVRGRWFEVGAGDTRFPAFATFHPEELITTPASKRFVWQDLLRFRAELASPPAG